MVRCSRCGVDVDESFKVCPNCGNSLINGQSDEKISDENLAVCSKCGADLKDDEAFCSSCGTKVEAITDNRCESCGSEVPPNVLFCPTCGTKVKQKKLQPPAKRCGNCGSVLEDGTAFCQECGANVVTGEIAQVPQINQNVSFLDKINFESILKPTIVALIVSIVLSLILFVIGFSWLSFIIAIVLGVGFFAGLIDNEANAMVSGFFVGLILGFLENPLVEFLFGRFAAIFYEWFFGGQLVILVILGIIVAYISNKYLKDKIQDIAGNSFSWL